MIWMIFFISFRWWYYRWIGPVIWSRVKFCIFQMIEIGWVGLVLMQFFNWSPVRFVLIYHLQILLRMQKANYSKVNDVQKTKFTDFRRKIKQEKNRYIFIRNFVELLNSLQTQTRLMNQNQRELWIYSHYTHCIFQSYLHTTLKYNILTSLAQ